MDDPLVLETPTSRAEIALLGAELRRWSVRGVELLWEPDAAIWPAVSPILFPIVGWAREGCIRVNGRNYPMGVHGFAAQEVFQAVEINPDAATFALRPNPLTLARYPFGFELEVRYRLGGDVLSIALEIRNSGAAAMPYACGLHPGFRWPFGQGRREDHRLLFDDLEAADVPRIAPGGLFSSRMRRAPVDGRELCLSDDALSQEALCFLDARSRGVTFDNGAGEQLRIDARGFRHWALWSQPPAPYLCIESWTGYGDPEDFVGELADKPSMIMLSPGEARTHHTTYQFSRK